MTKLFPGLAIASLVTVSAITSRADAQLLANRVASSSGRSVQFSYPARPGVCGDGRTYISMGSGNFYGSFSSNASDQCVAGPVRVVADLADRNVIALRTFVGGVTPVVDVGVANLGTVTAADATDYLLGVASRADGRVGRDAIFAAILADGIDLSPKPRHRAGCKSSARDPTRGSVRSRSQRRGAARQDRCSPRADRNE